MLDLVEVRVLGPFRVRTAAGALVDPRAWRTAKTRDLVRLLALAGGEPVPTESIVDALWPTPEPARGRASLRTAASQVRQVLGEDHLVRVSGGLAMAGVWVDALAFSGLATSARQLLAQGDLAVGVTTAWEAVNLYSGDLCEDSPYEEWVLAERERYSGLLRELLLDASEAAGELGWFRDSSELAHRVLLLDRCAERAYRCLMRAHSRLGETEQALGLYEACRRCLADELGVDPAPETQALHLSLLRADPVAVPEPPFVDRDGSLAQVGDTLLRAVEEARPVGVLLTGPPGSGRTRFVQRVLECWPHPVVEVRLPPAQPDRRGQVSDALARVLRESTRAPGIPRQRASDGAEAAAPLLLVVEDLNRAAPSDVAALEQALGRVGSGLSVLATATLVVPPLLASPRLPAGKPWQEVALLPLATEQVHAVVAGVLGAAPSSALVDEIVARTSGLPGAVVDVAAELLQAGDVLATSDGLARTPRRPGRLLGQEDARLARARVQTGDTGARALDVLAVLNRPTSAEQLAELVGADIRALSEALGQLGDLGVLARDGALSGFRDAVVREAAYRWLRPSVRAALHRAVAETARLPASERVDHWLRCDEPALACAAALEAADRSLADGDDARARAQLLRVRTFASEHGVGAADRIELQERLAEVAVRLGRADEARALLEDAVVMARADAPEVLARLYRRLGRLARTPSDALLAYEAASRAPGLDGRDLRRNALAMAAATTGATPAAAALVLERAVEEADYAGDVEAQVESRVLLCRAAALQREFALADRAGKAALVLAQSAGSDVLFVRAAHALVQTPACLGDGLQVWGLLQRAREHSLAGADVDTVVDVGLTCSLVLHDLGDPDFARVWRSLEGLARRGGSERLRRLLEALFTLEDGDPTRAARLLEELPAGGHATVAAHAARIVEARVAAASGDVGGAVAALTGVLEDPLSSTVSLLVPEAAARLAALQAGDDQSAARRSLALAVEVGGGRLHPREQVCVLRARAALLGADGNRAAAATVALAAALAAARAGLVAEAKAAHELRTALLDRTAARR